MKKEVKRKSIHVLSVLFIVPLFVRPEIFNELIYASLSIGLRLEIVRFYTGSLIMFDELLRDYERKNVAGYFNLVLGFTLLVSFTSNSVLIISGILIAALSDAIGAIVGTLYGSRVRTINGKRRSLEGTLAGFLTSLAILVPLLGPITGLIGAVLYVLNDLFRPGDDNISNPLVPLVAWNLVNFSRRILLGA